MMAVRSSAEFGFAKLRPERPAISFLSFRHDYLVWLSLILASLAGALLGAAVNGILGLIIFAIVFGPVWFYIERQDKQHGR